MTDTDKLAAYIKSHTAARGVDLWAVETQGYSATEWARETGRNRRTVSRNIERAREDDT